MEIVPQQVVPNVYRLLVPMPWKGLDYVNSYLVRGQDGYLLIDTGWNTDAAFDALEGQMRQVGVGLGDLRSIVVTHVHPDHYGLAGRLAQHSQAELVLHEVEQAVLHSRYVQAEDLLNEMDQWLRVNGVPDSDRTRLSHASMAAMGMVAVAMPTRPVRGGEHLQLVPFDLELLWTPGHSPGHICLFDRGQGLFFSGDHVLPGISPNVGLHTQAMGNPLADYQDSLAAIGNLPVKLVLPAHGDPFVDLAGRVQEMLPHHEERNQDILASLRGGRKTGYTVALSIPWNTKGVPWDKLNPWTKRAAITETLAHLEAMRAEGRVTKFVQGDCFWYGLP